MRTVGRLVLRCGIPPRVGMHNHAGTGQVETRIAGLERNEEHRGVVLVELVDQLKPLLLRGSAGDHVIVDAVLVQPLADQMQITGELRENQHLPTRITAGFHQLLDGVKLGGFLPGVLVYQPRIAANLPQPGQLGKRLDFLGAGIEVRISVDGSAQPLLERRIQFALLALQLDGDDVFNLVGQVAEYVLLETAQNERADKHLQSALRDGVTAENRHFEPTAEMLIAAEHPGHEEIENAPQFGQSVLNRRAGEREPMLGLDRTHCLRGFRRVVLHILCLIQRHAREVDITIIIDIAPQQII